jgi:hypothetical protein
MRNSCSTNWKPWWWEGSYPRARIC